MSREESQRTVRMGKVMMKSDDEAAPQLTLISGGEVEVDVVDQRQVVAGVEIEAYSISQADYSIGRRTSRPRPGVSEKGERFTRDTSIGSEYISRPFSTTREALFLLKSGLRKYLRDMY